MSMAFSTSSSSIPAAQSVCIRKGFCSGRISKLSSSRMTYLPTLGCSSSHFLISFPLEAGPSRSVTPTIKPLLKRKWVSSTGKSSPQFTIKSQHLSYIFSSVVSRESHRHDDVMTIFAPVSSQILLTRLMCFSDNSHLLANTLITPSKSKKIIFIVKTSNNYLCHAKIMP